MNKSTSSSRPRDIPAHTGLRGIAAVVVVLAHLKLNEAYPVPVIDFLTRYIYWQSQAVNLFFILSGFVLCHVYAFGPPVSWRNYGVARFARIYPLALATTLVLLALDGYSLLRHGIEFESLNLKSIAINVLLLNGLCDTWVSRGINPPSWSVSVEAFLYIFVFTGLTLLFSRFRFLKQRRVALISTGLFLSLFVGLNTATHYELVREYSWLARGVLGFIVGYSIRHLVESVEFEGKSTGHLLLGTISDVCFCALLTIHDPSYNDQNWKKWLMVPLAMIVFATYWDSNPLTRIFSIRVFTYLGGRFYSIYLIHHIAIEFINRLVLYPTQSPDGTFPLAARIQATAGILVTTLFVSALSYRFFEGPARDLIRRTWSKKNPELPIAVGVV